MKPAAQPRRPATYQDLVALPPHVIGEILDGELVVSPRPAPPHARSSSGLGGELFGPFDRGRGGPGGWWILDEPELHFGPEVVVPDLAGWRRARMAAPPPTAYFTLAPDWLAEVLSPSTALRDRTIKLDIYAREGVAHVWLIDPIARTVEVLRLVGGSWLVARTVGGDCHERVEPFAEVEIDLGSLWLPLATEPALP